MFRRLPKLKLDEQAIAAAQALDAIATNTGETGLAGFTGQLSTAQQFNRFVDPPKPPHGNWQSWTRRRDKRETGLPAYDVKALTTIIEVAPTLFTMRLSAALLKASEEQRTAFARIAPPPVRALVDEVRNYPDDLSILPAMEFVFRRRLAKAAETVRSSYSLPDNVRDEALAMVKIATETGPQGHAYSLREAKTAQAGDDPPGRRDSYSR